jgi:hypothetical protein
MTDIPFSAFQKLWMASRPSMDDLLRDRAPGDLAVVVRPKPDGRGKTWHHECLIIAIM